MRVSDFNYDLPEELIAQEPPADRAAARMLHLERATGELRDRQFREFPELLRPDDLVVFNNTRVFPARLYGRRGGARAQPVSPRNPAARKFLQGRVEVLLTRQLSQERNEWQALVRPGRKIGVGERLFFGEDDAGEGKTPTLAKPARVGHPDVDAGHPGPETELEAEVMARGSFGERTLRFAPAPDFFARVEHIGHMPLPPYIARADRAADRERYQTVYARERGSVAAPTAGLHFTPAILERLRVRGIATAEITLHVGLGTFQPVRVENVEEHRLHRERYEISETAAAALNAARRERRRIVAIGTTTVRTLEFCAREGEFRPGGGEADIFIYPGFEFRAVGALLTNFHLPQSTLVMLVAAFAGRERVLAAYRHAVEQQYRFYSYGDCMLIE